MSDLDLERLGDVWRQQPGRKELEELRRSAETVRRRARLGQVVDVLSAVVVAAVVLFLVLSNPEVETLLVGGAAILVLLVSHHRNRRLRDEELRALTESSEQMLDQTIRRLEATMKRYRFQLMALAPGLFLGLVVAAMASRSGDDLVTQLIPQSKLGLVIVAVIVLALVAAAIHFGRSSARTRDELNRLEALREVYRKEGASSAE